MATNLDSLDFLSPAQGPDELGRLGPYRLLKVLGRGGMGIVFKAEDTRLQRTVALKVMLPELAKRPTSRERFMREARATAKIEHDHIVTTYQVDEERGVPYLAMELLRGRSLEEFLRKKKGQKPLALEQTLKIGRETARGLAAAHEKGLIHRDIKPANLFLDASAGGRVKILDFGLARAAETEASRLTRVGQVVGTAAYMAPEQARGDDKIDARADLFSLGCVLYRLCTGRLPWTGEDPMATLLAIATETPVPVRELNPDVPPRFAELIHKLLGRKPEDRPASAKAVVEAITALEADLPTPVMKKVELPVSDSVGAAPTMMQSVDSTRISSSRSQRRSAAPLLMVAGAGMLVLLMGIVGIVAFFYLHNDGGTVAAENAQSDLTAEQPAKQTRPKEAVTGRAKTPPEPPIKNPNPRSEAPPPATTTKKPPLVVPTERDEPAAVKYEVNSLGMKLAPIQPGEFMMGASAEEITRHKVPDFARVDETPQHRVRITRPFLMAAHPVTVGQFRQFVQATSYRPDGGDGWTKPTFPQTDDHPVVGVTWNDAVAFCKWLSTKERRTYRLPTDAEWEYCCRAGSGTAYPFGEDAGKLREYVWFRANSGGSTHPVGKLSANAWGLHDMPGHVWQWVEDWYAPDYYKSSMADDPPGPATGFKMGEKPAKVMRGGSFVLDANGCRSAARKGRPADYRMFHAGFRVACDR
jgi:formylglycine-generating enzyme required for sulfatase activity